MKKTIAELLETIQYYMSNVVNGDSFRNEKDFENAVRRRLILKGFEILSNQMDVANAKKTLQEKSYANVERQIPDIVVDCAEGTMFLELKYRNTIPMYEDDILKVQKYVEEDVCYAAGVIFLDTNRMAEKENWKPCAANDEYYYFFDYTY